MTAIRAAGGWYCSSSFPSLLDKLWAWLDLPTGAFIVSLIGFGLSVWCFVEIFCLKGTKGPNRFGSDPLAKGNMGVRAIERRYA
jgi:uncharacterized membrane protein YhaH (DUF805 family)